ncbi:zona pellucida glycoprotein 3d tandem duplicate 1 isoform X1 [Anguilla rostrata]|uniref:zona pellucida glycoprotein 3d tandem duplicate 1 isoform X1 n=2 Tax=Anguilla rostrata TaxID=7938 RepID=UPI0030D18A36
MGILLPPTALNLCPWFWFPVLMKTLTGGGNKDIVSAGPVLSVGGWERKEQPGRRHEAIGPRMRGHETRTPGPILPPYQLPMFRHVKAPLVDMEMFRPTAGLRPVPDAVRNLLLPPPDNWLGYSTAPVSNPRGVEVWCGNGTVSVRVNRRMLGFWCHPPMLFLGNCEVYRFTRDYIYFHNDLARCGIKPRIDDGQLVYSSALRYVPEPQGAVIRAVPLSLPIHCSYNRFHYAYKVGYVPRLKADSFFKSITSERIFSLVTCNDRWERLDSTASYMLGAPMHFEASTPIVSRAERVSVTACHVTVSRDPNSAPRMDVIKNYGCMVDSQRLGSRSRFHGYGTGVLRFSVDAFVFPKISAKLLYLHCEMTVADYPATPTAKSCTFNSNTRRWEELFDPQTVHVCSCCDSQCDAHGIRPSLYPSPRSLITSDPWSILGAVTTTGTGGSVQDDRRESEVPEDVLEAEGVGPVAEPIDSEGAGSEAGPAETKEESEHPVQVRGFRGRGIGQGSGGHPSGVREEPLKAEGEPAVWREDDQGPDLDEEEEEEEDGGAQEDVEDEDGASSHAVAGKVLESLIM